jgi:hypothetical protein
VLTDNRGYYGNGGAVGEGAYWENAYNRRGDYGVGFFNATHLSAPAPITICRSEKSARLDPVGTGPSTLCWAAGQPTMFSRRTRVFPSTLQVTGTAGGQDARAGNRPNRYLPGFGYTGQSIDHWFGTADTICLTPGVNDGKCVYGAPDATSFGNSGKATERAPNFVSLDFNVSKEFPHYGIQIFPVPGPVLQPAEPPELLAAGAQHLRTGHVRRDHRYGLWALEPSRWL